VAVSPKLLRYAQRIVDKYDADKSGDLTLDELRGMTGKPAAADSNRDGKITVREFAEHAARFGAGRAIRLTHAGDGPLAQSQGAGQGAVTEAAPATVTATEATAARDPRRDLKYFAALPAGVPSWFVERDSDGDGQLSLAEFSPKLLKSEIDEFNRHDTNRDGIVTAKELLRSAKDPAAGAEAPKRGE
jgi:Ca2+-binding EF-hand superfamily protein